MDLSNAGEKYAFKVRGAKEAVDTSKVILLLSTAALKKKTPQEQLAQNSNIYFAHELAIWPGFGRNSTSLSWGGWVGTAPILLSHPPHNYIWLSAGAFTGAVARTPTLSTALISSWWPGAEGAHLGERARWKPSSPAPLPAQPG